MIWRRQRYAFGREIFYRPQCVTVIALGRFQFDRAFDLRLHFLFMTLNATGGDGLFLFGFAIFGKKVVACVGCLARRMTGKTIGDALAYVFVVRFVAERQRCFYAGLCRIQFGVDDLARKP